MRWSVCKSEADSEELEGLLAEGWEPFAVTREPVYNNPDSGWKQTGTEPHVWLKMCHEERKS